MVRIGEDYAQNVAHFEEKLRVSENFDIIKKVLKVADGEVTLFYVDGLIKDGAMQKLFIYLLSLQQMPPSAEAFLEQNMPYVECDVTENEETMLQMVLSGATLMLCSSLGAKGMIIDARTYPARTTAEPENDRVMRGARDGFVETLIFNTALIRRRIRDTSLTMTYLSVGSESKTDVVVCYMNGKADAEYVDELIKKIRSIKTKSLSMGAQSLAECLIRRRWYNPFPKVRMTERPDFTAAQILEGGVAIILDNSPEVLLLPSSMFDFMQETNDFYFPPITGTYISLVRYAVFLATLFVTPVWYLLLSYPELIPDWLAFIQPENTGRLPIIFQLFLVEFIIDALRLASSNTPDMLANSLSVVGGLILGDFAVDIGWLIPEVILYMAFVAIANFSQRSYELGYAFKFLRMFLLATTAIFKFWGFVAGVVIILVLLVTNKTVNGKRSYLYPLIPFNGRALASLLFRVKKKDFY